MRNPVKTLAAAGAMAAMLGSLAVVPGVAVAQEQEKSVVEQGKEVAFDRRKGNCLACHMVPGAESPGNIAPPLVGMKDRFPDRAKLRAQIWDATQMNPLSMMPPFGRHEILTEQEIDKIVEFLYSI